MSMYYFLERFVRIDAEYRCYICIGYGYDVLLVRSDNVQEYSGVEGIYSDTAFDHDQLNP